MTKQPIGIKIIEAGSNCYKSFYYLSDIIFTFDQNINEAMMNENFQILTTAEYNKLKDAIALITILIAGADGDVRQDELAWASKVTKIRSYHMKEDMKDFYKEVGLNYSDKLDMYFETLPASVEERTKLISDSLSELNPILEKLDIKVASRLYNSYLSFAEHVAKASGGFLGFFNINNEEVKFIKLPMIHSFLSQENEEE